MAMKTSTSLNLAEEVGEISKRLPSQEYILCKGLKQPFNNMNSGSRKIMQGIQIEQATQLLNAEVPIISTGYENQFGELNSNFIRAEHNYVVVDKICKFSSSPERHYWLILLNTDNNELSCIERISYKHITEFYGYIFDNEYLDNLEPGDGITKGDVIKRTVSYDEYNNRAEGLNMATLYIACEDVKEDPIVISESASKRFAAPMIDKVEVKINDNDILLNLYGEGKDYKTFPDIGESIKNHILCAVRRELKDEEALFSQSWDRLKDTMMNDKKYIVDGTIIDIDVFCNNPDKLTSVMYNSQIKYYYDQSIVFAGKFVDSVNKLLGDDCGKIKMSYQLQKKYMRCLSVVQGKQFIHDKVFNNIIMHVYVQKEVPLVRGDKITDRYGGKGVISRVKPDNMMPHYLKNGKWVPVDLMYSMCTCINRLNDGQLAETSITYAGRELLWYIRSKQIDYDTAFQWIYKFINIFNPEQAAELLEYYHLTYPPNDTSDEKFNRDMYIESMLHEGFIMLSLEPISSNISIDTIAQIYKEFPFLNKHCDICVPQQDSNGNYRMVMSRRKCVVGHKYIIRLKQFAIEKFSVVSLASTNIRNENSKSRMSKTHNARFPSTPVRVFGEMETSTIGSHIGTDIVYEEFMLSSSSPMGRREHKQLLTGDPFEFNVELNEDCTSLSADIGQAYLKTIGERIRFIKIRKFKRRPMIRQVVTFLPKKKRNVVYFIDDEDVRADKKATAKEIKRLNAADEKQSSQEQIDVVEVLPGVFEETEREMAHKKKLIRLGLLERK